MNLAELIQEFGHDTAIGMICDDVRSTITEIFSDVETHGLVDTLEDVKEILARLHSTDHAAHLDDCNTCNNLVDRHFMCMTGAVDATY